MGHQLYIILNLIGKSYLHARGWIRLIASKNYSPGKPYCPMQCPPIPCARLVLWTDDDVACLFLSNDATQEMILKLIVGCLIFHTPIAHKFQIIFEIINLILLIVYSSIVTATMRTLVCTLSEQFKRTRWRALRIRIICWESLYRVAVSILPVC